LKPTSFGIDREEMDGVHVLSVRGELDLATAPELREILDEGLEVEAPVLINLTDCEFIDSTGIAVIVRAWQQRQGQDGAAADSSTLALCAPGNQVSRLLDVTGVGTSITVFADCDEARAQLFKQHG
jgi:anti-sigma B factor antagonist